MKEGDEIPPQVVGDVLEWLAKRHLEKKEPFPVDEWLDPLLEMFLALADYARTKTKPDAPGVRAAYGADFLTFLGMSKGRARKLAAENSKVKVTEYAVEQAHKRMLRKRKLATKKPPGGQGGT